MKDWSSWLAEGDEAEQLAVIRRNIEKGLPCVSQPFLKKPEKKAGHVLKYRQQGWPKAHEKKG